ncbi:MAG: FAD binding domain-containing protein [bacterium]
MSLADIKEVCRPGSPLEAVELAGRYGREAAFLAGGTDLLLFCPPRLKVLIDLGRTGLSHIREEDGFLRIGALTSIQDLADSPRLKSCAGGILAEAASRCAKRPIRNAATIGGSLAGALFYADLPLPLLVLEARLRLLGRTEQEVSIGDFFRGARSTILEGDLLTEVIVPLHPRSFGSFEKLGRTRRDIALASACALVEEEEGVCRKARLAIGGAVAFPCRLPAVETFLEGQALDEALLQEAGRIVRTKIAPIKDFRAGADYRRELAGVLASRALAGAIERGRSAG